MVVEVKLPSTAFMVNQRPAMGAMTLPALSTFSRATDSCSREDLLLCIPASSWARVSCGWRWRSPAAAGGLVNFQLGGGADLEEGLQVVDVFLIEADLAFKYRRLVLIALNGGVVADAGGFVGGQGAAQVQGADHVAGSHGVAGLGVYGGALGAGGTMMEASLSAEILPETVLSAEMVVSLVTSATCTAVRRGRSPLGLTAAGRQAQGQHTGQQRGGNSLEIHKNTGPPSV
jgi:hypothetical protein